MNYLSTNTPCGCRRFAALLAALAFVSLSYAGFVRAAEPSSQDRESSGVQVWINPGVYSYHFDRNAGYRNDNVGLGAEVMVARDHGFMAGSFINSDRERSRYAAYEWRPLHGTIDKVGVGGGIAFSAFDGYPRYHSGGWFVAPLPVLSFEGRYLGLNLSAVPTIKDRLHGALMFQLKLRVW